MATKSKSSKAIPIIISIILILAISACATIAIPVIYSNVEKYSSKELSDPEYEINDEIFQSAFVLHQRVMEQRSSVMLKPIDIFFPDLKESQYGTTFDNEDEDTDYEILSRTLDNLSSSWQNSFDNILGANEYIILDDRGEIIYGQHSALFGLVENPEDNEISENYEFLTMLEVDDQGNVSAPLIKGANRDKLEKFLFSNKFSQYLSRSIELQYSVPHDYLEEAMKYFAPPENLTVILGVPKGAAYNQNYREEALVRYSLEPIVFPILLIILAFLIIIVVSLKYGAKVNFRLAEKLHLETMVILLVVVLLFVVVLFSLAASSCLAKFSILDWGIDLLGLSAVLVSSIAFFLLLLFTCFLTICILYSLFQIRELGIPQFFRQRSYIVKSFVSFFHWLGDISITKINRRNLIKLLIINFILVYIVTSLGANGGFLLIIYSIFLYFWASRKIKKTTKSYDELLTVTNGMVEGNFDVEYKENLGMFEPLGNQIKQIQNGFRTAIEAEGKSQSMKTELIANVSHDLKTPLTSIITYVDLLKNSSVTPEDQKKYIDTLEQKSNRLKVLIENLFEMSKVSSGNVTPVITTVDLVRLLKQLEFELSDESKKNSIEFHIRHTLEEAKVQLDSEMTYRVFDNLMINAIKYSLPSTRAYVDIYQKGSEIIVEMKNTSASPLDFSLDDLTERFVRGDESRNTEGSGLGLAIAKSFVELQNGSFAISADGDLFKVTVAFSTVERPVSPTPHSEGASQKNPAEVVIQPLAEAPLNTEGFDLAYNQKQAMNAIEPPQPIKPLPILETLPNTSVKKEKESKKKVAKAAKKAVPHEEVSPEPDLDITLP